MSSEVLGCCVLMASAFPSEPHSRPTFLYFIYLFIYGVCSCMCIHVAYAMMYMWWSEDNSGVGSLFLPFCSAED